MHLNGERDFVGYGKHPPDPQWPDGARLALNFVVNVEEGGEPSVPDGAARSESALTELGPQPSDVRGRDLAAESMFEYGSRVAAWRVFGLFASAGIPCTVFACAEALRRNSALCSEIRVRDWDVCAHGFRWEKHYALDEDTERGRIRDTVASIRETTGARPLGWYCRYGPSLNTRQAAGRGGRLPLRQRLLCRRAAVLDPRGRQAPPGGAVLSRHQRHQVRPRRHRHRRAVLRVPARLGRGAARRRRTHAEDDVGRAASSPGRAPRTVQGTAAVRGLAGRTGRDLVREAHRHRPTLDGRASARPATIRRRADTGSGRMTDPKSPPTDIGPFESGGGSGREPGCSGRRPGMPADARRCIFTLSTRRRHRMPWPPARQGGP